MLMKRLDDSAKATEMIHAIDKAQAKAATELKHAIDDIADDPRLDPDEKISRLNGFEAALQNADSSDAGFAKAYAIRDSMTETHIDARHCVDLLRAFKQDAVKSQIGRAHV